MSGAAPVRVPERIRAPGLRAAVEVVLDQWGIPVVRAGSAHDACFAQGWLHASERMFMMEVLRRVASGRLAELIGAPGLRSDRLMRTLGFQRAAQAEVVLLPDAVVAEVRAYAAGVSAWIEAHPGRGKGAELRALCARLEPWTATDCLLASRLFALGLCGNWEAELTRAEVAARFGGDVLDAFDGDDDARDRAASGDLDPEVLRAVREAGSIARGVLGGGSPTAGSNAWAVAASRTRTGGALLAGDTHLDLSLPCTWFEVGMRYDDVSVRGCSIPGSPGVVLGTNGHVAWTLVNSTADVQDLYVEQVDDATDTWRDADGAWRPLEVREERLRVRFGLARVQRVRSTPRGPLLTDVVEHGRGEGLQLALRWPTGTEPGSLATAVHGLARARTREAFEAAAANWSAPSQQLVYADRDGHVGRLLVGEIPVRAGSDGRLPLDAHDPRGEWVGSVPRDELPAERDPECGFVACANDRFEPESATGGGDAPRHFVSRDWGNPYRARRIREVLGGLDASDVDDHARLQLDTRSIPGRTLQALVAARDDVAPGTDAGRRALAALLAWNGDLTASSAGGAVYGTTMEHLRATLWAPLGDLAGPMLGVSRGPAGGTFPTMYGRSTPRILHDLARDDETLLRLTPTRTGGWGELLGIALDAAGAQLDATCGDHPWSWGALHRIRVAHGLGFVPGVHRVLSRGPWPIGGDLDTVWQASAAPKVHNEHAMVGPAQRMVIDLADPDRSLAVLCGGQSGHSGSPHYADQLELWRTGMLRPMPFTDAAVDRLAARRVTLVP